MKNFIIFLSLIAASFACNAQNAAVNASGNYVSLKSVKADSNKATGKTFTDAKGIVYPVMISINGKLFYVRTSKAGNEYKVYLKVN